MALVAATSLAPDGTEVYDSACAICHKAMAPRLGDKAAWEPRLKQGTDALVASVVKEKGAMPPMAGKNGVTQADTMIAISSKRWPGALKSAVAVRPRLPPLLAARH